MRVVDAERSVADVQHGVHLGRRGALGSGRRHRQRADRGRREHQVVVRPIGEQRSLEVGAEGVDRRRGHRCRTPGRPSPGRGRNVPSRQHRPPLVSTCSARRRHLRTPRPRPRIRRGRPGRGSHVGPYRFDGARWPPGSSASAPGSARLAEIDVEGLVVLDLGEHAWRRGEVGDVDRAALAVGELRRALRPARRRSPGRGRQGTRSRRAIRSRGSSPSWSSTTVRSAVTVFEPGNRIGPSSSTMSAIRSTLPTRNRVAEVGRPAPGCGRSAWATPNRTSPSTTKKRDAAEHGHDGAGERCTSSSIRAAAWRCQSGRCVALSHMAGAA